jgi:hypothetical protein
MEENMYIEKTNAQRIGARKMLQHVKKRIAEYNGLYPRRKIVMSEYEIDEAALSLSELNDAVLSGSDVFADCVKEPSGNLDTGKHYYVMRYCMYDKKTRKSLCKTLCLYDFVRAVGGESQLRHRYINRYVFSSSAIGMSRMLDAIDGVFVFLKSIGGVYCQL